MKILHILSQMPDFTGSGKYVQEMIRQSRERGHEPFLVTGVAGGFVLPTDLLPARNCHVIRFDNHDLSFPVMGMSDVMPYPSSVCSSLTRLQIIEYQNVFARFIRTAIAEYAPDVIHSNHLWMASAVARDVAPHLPLVTTCHGTCLRQHRLCPDLGQSLRTRLQGIDRVIALFERQRTDIVDLLGMEPGRVHVISGGFNQECFFADDQETSGKEVQLLYAGKLAFAKGVPWLLKSLRQIREPWHLHLVGTGSGPECDECLRLAAGHGDKVTVHGMLSHAELGRLMRTSDVFVLPSFYEGLPLVLLEALACGCRIVTTNLPGVLELFAEPHPDMVRLVELMPLETVDSPFVADEPMLKNRLAAALRATIVNVADGIVPDQKYVRNVTEPYGWNNIFLKIEEVYAKALRDRS